jgi:hypothetical protein
VLSALEKIPKGEKLDYAELVKSGLFDAIDLPEQDMQLLEKVMIETKSGSVITFQTLKNAGLIDQLDKEQL